MFRDGSKGVQKGFRKWSLEGNHGSPESCLGSPGGQARVTWGSVEGHQGVSQGSPGDSRGSPGGQPGVTRGSLEYFHTTAKTHKQTPIYRETPFVVTAGFPSQYTTVNRSLTVDIDRNAT